MSQEIADSGIALLIHHCQQGVSYSLIGRVTDGPQTEKRDSCLCSNFANRFALHVHCQGSGQLMSTQL
jgi:hypothetical protein